MLIPADYDALISAIYERDVDAVKAAVAVLPADPPPGQTTGLYLAAVQDEVDLVRLFLEAGADPNRISDGDSSEGLPLCAAAAWDHVDVARLLVAAGADPDLAEDDDGYTARRWAQSRGYTRILKLF